MAGGEVVVVDYDIGNVFSVCHAIRHAGGTPVLTGDLDRIAAADRLVLPGVGAFGKAVDELQTRGLTEPIRAFCATGRPFLGLCVGMQMLMDRSTEFGSHDGFGLVEGIVDRIATGQDGSLRVPHIGWTELLTPDGASDARWSGGLLADLTPGRSAFYFVHSYAVYPTKRADILAEVAYGDTRIVAAIQHDNILGVQFHPERSGLAGQKVLRRFLRL